MTYTQSAVLGVVQGLTEFLPVSSSGHLILAPRLLGWPDQGLAWDAAVHLGTLVALLAYFRRDLGRMVRGVDLGLGVLLAVATVPAAAAGLLLGPAIEAHLRSPRLVAAGLIGWGLLMWAADRHAARRRSAVTDPRQVGWGPGLLVGVAQALALVPGTSRSGVTITAGLAAGLSRAAAARFAFLLGIPVTAGAGGLKTLALLGQGLDAAVLGPLLLGMVTAFAAGLGAVWFLVRFLERRSLLPFVAYRWALGLVILGAFP
jgi:undecaprenyl-diphosphatase